MPAIVFHGTRIKWSIKSPAKIESRVAGEWSIRGVVTPRGSWTIVKASPSKWLVVNQKIVDRTFVTRVAGLRESGEGPEGPGRGRVAAVHWQF